LGEASASPYGFAWSNVTSGNYTVTAKATDNLGATAISSPVDVVVKQAGNLPPVVTITSPENRATFPPGSTVTITATATDSDGSIGRVEFYGDSTLLGTASTTPYKFTWENVQPYADELRAELMAYARAHLSHVKSPRVIDFMAELDDASAAVRALLSERVPNEVRNDTRSAIGVAGTLTSIAGLALGLEEYDRDRVHGFELTAEALDEQLQRLASVPLAERRKLRPLDPDRAPVIVGGAVIAREVLGFFGLDKLEISERDILDGAALAAAELPDEEEGAAPPGAYTCC
jgi:hypothetical protein